MNHADVGAPPRATTWLPPATSRTVAPVRNEDRCRSLSRLNVARRPSSVPKSSAVAGRASAGPGAGGPGGGGRGRGSGRAGGGGPQRGQPPPPLGSGTADAWHEQGGQADEDEDDGG